MTKLTFALKSLLNYLATGDYYSGQQLGALLGVSRTAIWKMINKLQQLGVAIERIPNRGYRIQHGYRPLLPEKILDAISKTHRENLSEIIIHSIVDSTNNYLLKNRHMASATVCLAEYQTMGRGRRNRRWQAGFGKNILMSLSWNFEQGSSAMVGLSMTIALAILRAFRQYGMHGFQVKWPNDVLWQQQKVAGVLIETQIDSLGICHAVIGIGVNVEKNDNDAMVERIDLESITNRLPDRNHLAGLILDYLLQILPAFAQAGFSKYRDEWLQYDCLLGKWVTIHGLQNNIQGKVIGIDEQGGLMIQQNNDVHTFHTGEISVREQL